MDRIDEIKQLYADTGDIRIGDVETILYALLQKDTEQSQTCFCVKLKKGKIKMDEVKRLNEEIQRLNEWVNDLQSGMYINCVYCGHRYGPRESTPTSMADVLKKHIEQCPKHPMSKLKAENLTLHRHLAEIDTYLQHYKDYPLIANLIGIREAQQK